MGRRKNNGIGRARKWTHDQIMARAANLFGSKFTESGAGRYTAEELRKVLDDLEKNPPSF